MTLEEARDAILGEAENYYVSSRLHARHTLLSTFKIRVAEILREFSESQYEAAYEDCQRNVGDWHKPPGY